MNKIRCEYCRRGCPAEEFECPRCGAPLDLPGPFMAYRKEPNVLRVERDR
jgi:hypothetical protein